MGDFAELSQLYLIAQTIGPRPRFQLCQLGAWTHSLGHIAARYEQSRKGESLAETRRRHIPNGRNSQRQRQEEKGCF